MAQIFIKKIDIFEGKQGHSIKHEGGGRCWGREGRREGGRGREREREREKTHFVASHESEDDFLTPEC
jgi:hypothetical protein